MNHMQACFPESAAQGKIRQLFAADDLTICIDVNNIAADAAGSNADAAGLQNESTVPEQLQPLHNAIALAECDEILQCLSSWFDCDFDWQPVYPGSAVPVNLTLSSKTHPTMQLGVSLTAKRLAHLAAMPESWESRVSAITHVQSVMPCIEALSLSEEDTNRLAPGSCLLLPGSFGHRSRVDLYEQNREQVIAQGFLDHQSGVLFARSSLNQTNEAINSAESVDVNAGGESASVAEFVSVDKSSNHQRTKHSIGSEECAVRVFLNRTLKIDLAQWQARSEHHPLVESASAVTLANLNGQRVTALINGNEDTMAGQLVLVAGGLAVVFDR